jgi:hypothetical protein
VRENTVTVYSSEHNLIYLVIKSVEVYVHFINIYG